MPMQTTRAEQSATDKIVEKHPSELRTREQVRAYLAAHLTPVRFGPKGQPIYAHEDIEKLNVRFFPDL